MTGGSPPRTPAPDHSRSQAGSDPRNLSFVRMYAKQQCLPKVCTGGDTTTHRAGCATQCRSPRGDRLAWVDFEIRSKLCAGVFTRHGFTLLHLCPPCTHVSSTPTFVAAPKTPRIEQGGLPFTRRRLRTLHRLCARSTHGAPATWTSIRTRNDDEGVKPRTLFDPPRRHALSFPSPPVRLPKARAATPVSTTLTSTLSLLRMGQAREKVKDTVQLALLLETDVLCVILDPHRRAGH
mgnify:CR=1 FL=1